MGRPCSHLLLPCSTPPFSHSNRRAWLGPWEGQSVCRLTLLLHPSPLLQSRLHLLALLSLLLLLHQLWAQPLLLPLRLPLLHHSPQCRVLS